MFFLPRGLLAVLFLCQTFKRYEFQLVWTSLEILKFVFFFFYVVYMSTKNAWMDINTIYFRKSFDRLVCIGVLSITIIIFFFFVNL